MDDVVVRPMNNSDAAAVIAIYQAGIDTGHATFEASAPRWSSWSGAHLDHSRLIAARDSEVLGWAALAPVSTRDVYRGVAEVSVYVDPSATGIGIGGGLMAALIESAETNGMWTLQAAVFEENQPSLRLHARHGFRIVGRRERIGLMRHGPLAGRWRDTLLLERRSATVGAN